MFLYYLKRYQTTTVLKIKKNCKNKKSAFCNLTILIKILILISQKKFYLAHSTKRLLLNCYYYYIRNSESKILLKFTD